MEIFYISHLTLRRPFGTGSEGLGYPWSGTDGTGSREVLKCRGYGCGYQVGVEQGR